ncbi:MULTISPECIES: Gfo/Idh/MocA family oxidoreductase [Hydrotalea]|uniref:Gfo/Idh/MocA family oxidoreductase n=1 Tax=Hydrotalea TaxID=1004300 RepID=UPI00094640FF|nr:MULTISPECIES: Gfo/Idh/MocA family oxidoreductase [Hydrotalea]
MNAPIKTALLSFGMSGKVFHAPFIDAHPGYILVGAWERTKKQIQQIYPYAKSYNTLEELLADDIDLVIVNTPNDTHYEYTRQALLAGKNVVLEKPITVTTEEANALKSLALQQSKIICPYQNRRYNSDYLTTKRIIDSGVLGTIVEAEFRFDRYAPHLSSKAHKETGKPGTGVLYDLGSHLIDQALQLFGKPEALFADIAVTRPGSVIDDYFELLLYYKHCRVRLKSGYFVREPLPGYIVFGTAGSFLKSKADVQENHLIEGKKPTTPNWGIEPEAEQGLLHTAIDGKIIRENVPTEKGDYMGYFEALYQALVNQQPLPVTIDESTAVIAIIEKAFESNQKGCKVMLS